MQDRYIHIKDVALKNNCPVCYNNEGLYLTFKQRIIDTKFFERVTSEIRHELHCKTCNSPIYPVQWTDDIEQVFEYLQRSFTPKKTGTTLKRPSWILLSGLLIVLVSGLSLLLYYTLQE